MQILLFIMAVKVEFIEYSASNLKLFRQKIKLGYASESSPKWKINYQSFYFSIPVRRRNV